MDGQERTMLLSAYRNRIYFQTFLAETGGRPVMLCNDFLKNLSDAACQGTIYYAYISTDSHIYIKNIMGQLYQLPEENGLSIQPCLVSFQEKLLLLYVMENPIHHTWRLKGIFPFEDHLTLSVPDAFSAVPEIHYLVSAGHLFLFLSCGNQHKAYEIDGKLQSFPLGNVDVITERNRQEYEAELKEKDAVIESIKRQYEELMQTAYRYQEEAGKWRTKYYTKK